MKKFVNLMSVCLSATVLASAFAGCGGPKNKIVDNETTLNIYMLNAGYDVKFMDKYEEMFEKQNPGIDVKFKPSTEAYTKIYEDLRLGAGRNPYDLYLAPDQGWQLSIEEDHPDGTPCVLENLDDLYQEKIPGEDVTISEKLYEGLEFYSYYKGHHYYVPWAGGPAGIVYNTELFEKNNVEVPRTSDELIAAASKSYGTYTNTDGTGDETICGYMTSEAGAGYLEYIGDTWWAQYEGVQRYRDFYTLGNDPTDPESKGSKENYIEDVGIRESTKVIFDLSNKTNVYPQSKNTLHTTAQMNFLFGKAAMMPCGNWLQAEMNQNFTDNEMPFKMMKTPILSAMADVEQLAIPGKDHAEKDKNLSLLVKYVDSNNEADKPAWATEQQIAVIREARKVVWNVGSAHTAFIPSYSNAKDLAKKFILMMATDEAISNYVDIVHTTTAFKYDYRSKTNEGPLFDSYIDIIENSVAINSSAFAVPERVRNSLKKLNAHANAYKEIQEANYGDKTVNKILADEIARAKEIFDTMQ